MEKETKETVREVGLTVLIIFAIIGFVITVAWTYNNIKETKDLRLEEAEKICGKGNVSKIKFEKEDYTAYRHWSKEYSVICKDGVFQI